MSALKWTRKDTWGTIGYTHRTSIFIGADEHSFQVSQPRKGFWVAVGWINGKSMLYREAKTLAEGKQIVALAVAGLSRKEAS